MQAFRGGGGEQSDLTAFLSLASLNKKEESQVGVPCGVGVSSPVWVAEGLLSSFSLQ